MKTTHQTVMIPALLAVLCVLALASWFTLTPSNQLATRTSGLDGTPESASSNDARELAATEVTVGPGKPSVLSGSWKGFRGDLRDGISADPTSLARSWPSDGPPIQWQIDVAEGYAAAAIDRGRVYVLDYDVANRLDLLRCLSLDDGQEIWRTGYPAEVSPNHGMTRTIPAISGNSVVTIGPRCSVACWDAETGENRWLFSMVERYGSEERQWYTGQCPLIDAERVILAPCGEDSLMVALDLNTGDELWRTPNPRKWKMSHASIMPMEVQGESMYVYCGNGGTAGVSAKEGRLLWDEASWEEHFATSPSPLLLPGDRIFLCSGYDSVGAMFLNLAKDGDRIVASAGEKLDRKIFNSEQQTPVLYQQHMYGIRKNRGGQFVCMDLNGNEVWNSGQDKFGNGPYMIADGLILMLSDDARLVAAEASPDGYRRLWEKQVLEHGNEAWGPMAITSGRLIVRDLTRLVCLDLRSSSEAP